MKLPWRRPAVPAGVKASVDLGSDERVLSIALSGDTAYVVATTVGMYVLVPQADPDEYGVSFRIRWDEIDKARWDAPMLELDLGPTAAISEGRTVRVEIDKDSQLPAAIRDRVNDSIIASEEISILDGTARVVARRRTDTGETDWRVILGPGLDPNDADVRQSAQEGLKAYRSRIGV